MPTAHRAGWTLGVWPVDLVQEMTWKLGWLPCRTLPLQRPKRSRRAAGTGPHAHRRRIRRTRNNNNIYYSMKRLQSMCPGAGGVSVQVGCSESCIHPLSSNAIPIRAGTCNRNLTFGFDCWAGLRGVRSCRQMIMSAALIGWMARWSHARRGRSSSSG